MTQDQPSLRVRRLTADELADAIRRLAGDSSLSSLDHATPADRGLLVESGGNPLLVAGLQQNAGIRGPGFSRVRALRVSVAWIASPDSSPAVTAAVVGALRELFFGQYHWHVLRIRDAPSRAIDACWRFAARLGYSCVVTQEPPPTRTRAGEVIDTPPLLTVYSSGLKGRWQRAVDAGVLIGIRKVAGGPASQSVLDRLRGADRDTSDEVGSRFFALDLASVASSPTWGNEVTFREIAPTEVAEHPLRYGTSIKRVEQSLRRGDRCFATLVDGELAHHHWVSRDPDFLGKMLPEHVLRRPTAHPFDAFTFPVFRGRGLQGSTHHWLAWQYRAEGVEQFAVRISSFNAASMRGVQKVGYVEISPDDPELGGTRTGEG